MEQKEGAKDSVKSEIKVQEQPKAVKVDPAKPEVNYAKIARARRLRFSRGVSSVLFFGIGFGSAFYLAEELNLGQTRSLAHYRH